MTVNVGIIGVGMIGQDHIRRLTQVLPGAAVVAVTDVNAEQAQQVADGVPGAKVFATGQELIAHESVDAVVICSWGPTHAGAGQQGTRLIGSGAGRQGFRLAAMRPRLNGHQRPGTHGSGSPGRPRYPRKHPFRPAW